MITGKNIKVICSDKVELAATVFSPVNIRGAIMIAPATGIKRSFYNSFANYLAENNFGVITYDNRGIGGSLSGHVKKSNASLISWGQLDMPAVLDALKVNFPDTEYHLVGHSAGGQLSGLMHNASELTSIFNYGSSSGRLKNLRFPFKFRAIFFMHVFIPFNNFFWGYTNAQWMNLGEPLPKMVTRQWREWCSGGGYVKVHLDKDQINYSYNDMSCPSIWINAADDDISNDDNVKDMIRVFPNIKAATKTLIPEEFGLKAIGHMGFFSARNKVLWKLALEWFERTDR